MVAALQHWQTTRQLRVDKLLDLTSKMNNMRLPVQEQQKLAAGEIWRDEEQGKGEGRSIEWLFLPRLEEDVLSWVEQRGPGVGGCISQDATSLQFQYML